MTINSCRKSNRPTKKIGRVECGRRKRKNAELENVFKCTNITADVISDFKDSKRVDKSSDGANSPYGVKHPKQNKTGICNNTKKSSGITWRGLELKRKNDT